MQLKLERPLIFFDLETTGTNIAKDRIVEISIIKLYPDSDKPREFVQRVNPDMPIPAEASAVHHITDEDVKDSPKFSEIAQGIAKTFEGCDIAGFNSVKFDLPLLCQEMSRAHVFFNVRDSRLIDVQNIYHKKEPRNLSAAYRFYCDKNLDDTHSALADTRATMEVFFAQLERYADLPKEIDELEKFSQFNRNVDLTGKLVKNDKNQIVLNFGKHKGKLLSEVLKSEPSYYDWIVSNEDFPVDFKQIVTSVYNSIN